MRLHLILPRVEPEQIVPPTACPKAGCGGQHFHRHQRVAKSVRDTVYEAVMAER